MRIVFLVTHPDGTELIFNDLEGVRDEAQMDHRPDLRKLMKGETKLREWDKEGWTTARAIAFPGG